MGMNKRAKYLLIAAAVLLLGVLSTQVENRHLPLPHHGQPWPSEDHWSLVQQLFPGLVHNAMQLLAPHPTWIEHKAPSQVTHVFMALLVVLLLLAGSLLVFLRMRARPPVVPDEKMGVFGVFEMLAEAVLSFMSGLMDERRAHFFFPLIAAFAFFILSCNLLGMVPGFLPPTAVLNTTLGLGLIVFFVTHYYGLKVHGLGYLKEFLGPIQKWYALPLMILMLFIELISHLVRPVSLGVRLMGNMMGDHKVTAIFLSFGVLFVPIPMMFLGLLVAFVQTLVFCLLSVVYIALATEESPGHESPKEE
jgi:F-type H+-transporting ATPase subunit a